MRSGVQHDAGDEPLADLVTQPGEMAGVARAGAALCLHLDADHPTATELREEVHLMATPFGSQVVEPRLRYGSGQLDSELRRDEGLQQPPEEQTVSHRTPRIDAQHGAQQAGVDQVALRLVDQSLEPVRVPRRHRFGYEEPLQQILVRDRGHLAYAGGVVDRLRLGDGRRCERVGLEVSAQSTRAPALSAERCEIATEEIVDIAP